MPMRLAPDPDGDRRAEQQPTRIPVLALASSTMEPLLQDVVDALPFGVSIHDENGRRVLNNKTATALRLTIDLPPASAREPEGFPVEVLVSQPGGPATIETTRRSVESAGRRYWLTTTVDITDRKTIERELFDRAYLDELTGLPNRSLVQQSTETLIETVGIDGFFALAFVDLDNFKHINDYYGHTVGDQLLVRIGKRLSESVGPENVVARIGGDEFVLLLTDVADSGSVAREVEALGTRLKQPFFIEGYEIFASASIGISLYPQHGYTYDTLRRNADNAMYRVKSGIKGGTALFDTTMGQAATDRMALEQRLRLAIRDRRFCCAFQPKVDLRSHTVVGVEVLLRWRDEHGLIKAPGDFISLAVELGLINDITHLVLAETMRLIDEIDQVFGPTVSISINIAAKQVEDLAFMRSLVEAIAATGCPTRFVLELTEEAFFARSRFQSSVLPQLRAMGTKVSIDDFGVGYSSLAALADITADEIKIDRSFITDIHRRPRSQSVLRAIESLSHALGMSITAEGVETEQELIYLQAATRIHHVQGFYFARPQMLDEPRSSAVTPDYRALAGAGRALGPLGGGAIQLTAGRLR